MTSADSKRLRIKRGKSIGETIRIREQRSPSGCGFAEVLENVRRLKMHWKERRFTPRHKLQIPLTIQPLAGSKMPAQLAHSTDVSIRGVYFATDLLLEIGTPIRVLLRMPEEITGKASPRWSCTGRVVRVDKAEESNGKRGIGVEIHYYDVLKA